MNRVSPPVSEAPCAEQALHHRGGRRVIGSPFCDDLLAGGAGAAVTLYDDFSSGREWHYAQHAKDARLRVVRGEVEDTAALAEAMDGHDVVTHLPPPRHRARGASRQSTLTGPRSPARYRGDTHDQREADPVRLGERRLRRSRDPRGRGGSRPVAARLDLRRRRAGPRALIASLRHLRPLRGFAFRFGSVVGPRQTHGVGFDFARASAGGCAGEERVAPHPGRRGQSSPTSTSRTSSGRLTATKNRRRRSRPSTSRRATTSPSPNCGDRGRVRRTTGGQP